MDTQTIISLAIVAVAVLWCGRFFYQYIQAARKPPNAESKDGKSCSGGCGCGLKK